MGKLYLFNVYIFCKSLCVSNLASPYGLHGVPIYILYLDDQMWLVWHKLILMLTIQYTKDGGKQLRCQCYRRHQKKTQICPDSVSLAWEEKEQYANPLTNGKWMSYRKIGRTTVAVTQDLPSGMPLVLQEKNSSSFETVYYLNQDNPVPNCPNSYTSLHARRPIIQ